MLAGIGESPRDHALEPHALEAREDLDPSLAFDAAISGLGVLLAVDEMSADAVSDRRLVRPFDITAESGVGYWLVVSDGRSEPKKVRAFREWMRKEWPDSVDGYVAQLERSRQREAPGQTA